MFSNLKKNFNLNNKTAIITGSAGLLGEEHALALLDIGARVILTDINEKKLIKSYKKLKKRYSKIIPFVLDVTKIQSLIKLNEYLIKKKIKVDILINNAAIDSKFVKDNKQGNFENFTLNQWNNELSVGLSGAMLCSQIFGSQMVKNKGGVILNIASDLSVIAPNQSLYKTKNKSKKDFYKPVTYSVIKTGLIGLTRYIATYWNTKNVRCNALSPGGVENNQKKEFKEKLKSLIPLGRMARKNEYRGAIQFLCSDASKYMNGQNIIIDGGRSVWWLLYNFFYD